MIGKELQPFNVDPNFALLGFGCSRSEDDFGRRTHGVLDDCLIASEIYEYGFTLNNSVFRISSLYSMKLLHGMRLIDMGYMKEGKEFVEDCKDNMKQYHISNTSLSHEINILENRLSGSELKYVCVMIF